MIVERRLNTVLSILLVISGVIITYTLTRLYTTYRNETEIKLLKQRVDQLESENKVQKEALDSKIELMYYTLYEAQIDVKKEASKIARRPSVIEAWQVTRDKELRNRITVLERWRMSADRNLNR